MTPTRARTLTRITLAIATSLAVSLPAFVATDARAQLITQEDRCQAALAKTSRKYLERVLKYRIRCQNKVITGDLPLATDCLFGLGDEGLSKKLFKAQARLSVAGSDCNGVNLQLLGFPNLCDDPNGGPFDTSDFKECVLDRTDAILDELLDYYYPPLFERQRGDIALCLQGTPQDAMASLIGKIRAREKCLVGQAYGKIHEDDVHCYEKILPYGGGTGDRKTDDALGRAYVELLGSIPKACAITNIDDLDYQDKCEDLTGGNFNIFDLKNCLFAADRVAALEALGTVFPTEAICGDGQKQGEEECDNGVAGNSDTTPNACRTNCTNPKCGDGVRDNGAPNNEACDDGNLSNTDGCLNTCVAASCGDSFVQAGVEQCDNGPLNANEPNKCRASGPHACRNPRCGDSIEDSAEECDDGNTTSEDLCSSLCFDEFCGDEIVQVGLGEECDDGVDNGTGPNQCRPQGHPFECKEAFCGDGVVDSKEECDSPDRNACTEDCENVGFCGDGEVNGNEQCDDGTENNSDTEPDACRTDCKNARCGDTVVDTGESCDDGNTANGDTCNSECGTCGDGIKQASEQCDGSNDPCPAGVCIADSCTCQIACPTEGELVLYAGLGKECTNNSDCDVGECSQEFGRCKTVTRLDSGWIGLAHNADINDEVVTRGFLDCSNSHGPTCGECNVAGIDPQTDTCRCANDTHKVCDDKFNANSSDCGQCVGGDRNNRSCDTNADCAASCALRCTGDASRTCTTNADCQPEISFGTCSTTLTCANGTTACTTAAQCTTGTCTGTSACNCYFGAPFPLSSGGTPACIVNRFSEDVSGTANVDLGAGAITAKLRTQVFLGISTRAPCPMCGGTCSNDPSTWCVRDEDCPGGTCNDDPVENDGVRGGTCSVYSGGLDSGKPCDKGAYNSSFPAFTSGTNGGWYSLDCLPPTGVNVSGQGLIINLTQTTGPVSLEATVPCPSFAAEFNCPCLVCSSDSSVPCNTDLDCAGLQSKCSLSGSGQNAIACSNNAECQSRDVGPCNSATTGRCARKTSTLCTSNTDCLNQSVGTCPASTCTSFGTGQVPEPNQCENKDCSDVGGGIGECTTGPDTRYCAGLVKANGQGILTCGDDEGCAPGSVGIDARPCGLIERQSCFLDPITAQGVPDPETPIGASVFCIPPTSNTGINSAAGLPGPGKVLNQAKARTFCGNDTSKQYIPGVGGCVEGELNLKSSPDDDQRGRGKARD